MKIAIIGSRGISMKVGEYIPKEITEVVSGGAKGIDTSARDFANSKNLKYTEFLPEYHKYGKAAPLERNRKIVEYADMVIAIWYG